MRRSQIDKDNKKFQVKELLLEPAQPYKATFKYFMKDGREYVRELPGQKGQRFYVDDPFSATKTVQIRTRGDFERRIDTIFVDLTYDDETNKLSADLLDRAQQGQAVPGLEFSGHRRARGQGNLQGDDDLQGRYGDRSRGAQPGRARRCCSARTSPRCWSS